MARKDQQWRFVSESELIRDAAAGYADAKAALEHLDRIKAAGGHPVIRHSRFHGYQVRDRDAIGPTS